MKKDNKKTLKKQNTEESKLSDATSGGTASAANSGTLAQSAPAAAGAGGQRSQSNQSDGSGGYNRVSCCIFFVFELNLLISCSNIYLILILAVTILNEYVWRPRHFYRSVNVLRWHSRSTTKVVDFYFKHLLFVQKQNLILMNSTDDSTR